MKRKFLLGFNCLNEERKGGIAYYILPLFPPWLHPNLTSVAWRDPIPSLYSPVLSIFTLDFRYIKEDPSSIHMLRNYVEWILSIPLKMSQIISFPFPPTWNWNSTTFSLQEECTAFYWLFCAPQTKISKVTLIQATFLSTRH